MKTFYQFLESHSDLKEEMIQFLSSRYRKLSEDWQDEAEIAIYWFANDFHKGQFSDLYKILSTSPYKPGPMMKLEKEDEIIRMMYEDLTENFS